MNPIQSHTVGLSSDSGNVSTETWKMPGRLKIHGIHVTMRGIGSAGAEGFATLQIGTSSAMLGAPTGQTSSLLATAAMHLPTEGVNNAIMQEFDFFGGLDQTELKAIYVHLLSPGTSTTIAEVIFAWSLL